MSQEPDFYDSINIAEEEEQLRQIDESVIELNSIIEEMDLRGGVSKQTAIDLESLQPGLISNKRPINSYTRDYSQTNFRATMEDAETVRKGLFYAGLAALALLLAKILSWIFGSFGDSDGEGGGGGGGGKTKNELVVMRISTTITFINEYHGVYKDVGPKLIEICDRYRSLLRTHLPVAAQDHFQGVADLGSETKGLEFLKGLDDLKRYKVLENRFRAGGRKYIADLLKSDSSVRDDITFMAGPAINMFDKLSEVCKRFADDLKTNKELRLEDYKLLYEGKVAATTITDVDTLATAATTLVSSKNVWLEPEPDLVLWLASNVNLPLEKLLAINYRTEDMLKANDVYKAATDLDKTVAELKRISDGHKQVIVFSTGQTEIAKHIQSEIHRQLTQLVRILHVFSSLRDFTLKFMDDVKKSGHAIITLYKNLHAKFKADEKFAKADAEKMNALIEKLEEAWKKQDK